MITKFLPLLMWLAVESQLAASIGISSVVFKVTVEDEAELILPIK